MKKFKLINNKTKEEHLCDKVTIDGFDYYVSDNPKINNIIIYNNTIGKLVFTQDDLGQGYDIEIGTGVSYPIHEPLNLVKKVIATNNPNIDISKVVNEVEMMANYEFDEQQKSYEDSTEMFPFNDSAFLKAGFITGYNKSQETHSNSDEDMFGFHFWLLSNSWLYHPKHNVFINSKSERKSEKELLQFWKEQQPKIVYYE